MTLTYTAIEEIPLDILKNRDKKKQFNTNEQKFNNHENVNGVNFHKKKDKYVNAIK